MAAALSAARAGRRVVLLESQAALGGVLRRPAFLPVPPFVLRILFGTMADETVLASQRVRPARLQQLGFSWRHATLAEALAHTGPLPLRLRPDGFGPLLSAIVSQQVSVASADAIWGRLKTAGLTAADIAAIGITNQRETTLIWDRQGSKLEKQTTRPYHKWFSCFAFQVS